MFKNHSNNRNTAKEKRPQDLQDFQAFKKLISSKALSHKCKYFEGNVPDYEKGIINIF